MSEFVYASVKLFDRFIKWIALQFRLDESTHGMLCTLCTNSTVFEHDSFDFPFLDGERIRAFCFFFSQIYVYTFLKEE